MNGKLAGASEFTTVQLQLPAWVGEWVGEPDRIFASDEERMELVIGLSRENVRRRTGGPFGAAIFEGVSGRLLAPGVNLVEPSHCSVAHAEMVAIMVAQGRAGNHDLSAEGLPSCELFTSSEPCAMCFGAVPWSGVRRLVFGASKEAAEAVGFDEGAKPEDWPGALEARGIAVRGGLLEQRATEVLQEYASTGQAIYNAHHVSDL
ncbi:MAG: nucleoside deaminase [Deltaproteobacteria bacterium]|nr:nucleoside deaminase [Deltaproteobacteria bacterium]